MNAKIRTGLFLGLLLAGLVWTAHAGRCPFCSAVQQTFAEQMGTSDLVVLAELVRLPDQPPRDDQLPQAIFRVTEVLKGQPDFIAVGKEFRSIYVGQPQVGQVYLLMGVGPPDIAWTTPLKMSDAACDYLRAVPKLPAKGAERLKFFQDFFEHEESMLAFDAYEEFARASYAEVIELKPFMHRYKLLQWLQDSEVSTNRKRLYFTLLGVCGTDDDLPLLESMISADAGEARRGLDAMVACYLTLKGPAGLELIEREFFEDPTAEYVDAFAAISAVRFIASEHKDFPRERILAALHKVLERPSLADLVIPDLARWEDWSVIDKMVELFKNSNEDTKWVRVPVVSYLKVCPKPEAKDAIAELTKLDPESVRRAETLLKWESGDEELDADSDDSAEPAEPNPSQGDADGALEPATATSIDLGDAAETPNVPIYQVRRIPTEGGDPSAVPAANRGAEPRGQFVSTSPPRLESPDRFSANQNDKTESAALVASGSTLGGTLGLIFVPLGSFVLLLLLLWSVLNGWFERLIY
jgi:hypothetical protein